MIVGIVGSEEAKFTTLGRDRANSIIVELLSAPGITEVVSGKCHLGGIDIWAAQIGELLGLKVTEFAPKTHSWEGGYRPRNIQIAQHSDIVHCITVDSLPEGFKGMRFPYCYHCAAGDQLLGQDHVKSGGCWTMHKAVDLGKEGHLHIVRNY